MKIGHRNDMHMFSAYLEPNLRFKNIYFPPEKVRSYLINVDGSFAQLPKHINQTLFLFYK